MSYRLLSANGDVSSITTEEFAALTRVDPSDSVQALDQLSKLSSNEVALFELASSADGRALSVIGGITAQGGESKTLWVGGDLLPDQVSLAFQCGASAVVIDEPNWQARGEQDWLSALKPPVSVGYRSTVWSEVQGISAQRG